MGSRSFVRTVSSSQMKMPHVCPRYLALTNSYGLWPGAVLLCAQRSVTLRELHLNLPEMIRPDHIDYIHGRRHGELTIHVLSHIG
jgi:hypothetical protein